MNFYIEVNNLDYDDYPVGSPTKIGPFDTEAEAEQFLETSTRFRKEYYTTAGHFAWRVDGWGSRTSVRVKSLASGFRSPEEWM